MDGTSLTILILGAVCSLWLVYYVRFQLPRKLDDRFRESMRAFSTAIELRFPSQKGMTDEVVRLCGAVSKKMGLSVKQRNHLEMAAMLRDIGLCAIPYGMINSKPEMDWTEAERMTFDRHSEVSGAMLEMVPSLRSLAPTVRYHHADFSGETSGDLLPKGSEIPAEARVLKVVSEYVWMARTRGDLLAKESLRNGAGTAYDPQVVSAMMDVLTSARGRQALSFARA